MTEAVPNRHRVLTWLLEKSFGPLFGIYVYLLVLLPSGSVFGVNVKIICFALLLGPAIHRYLGNRTVTAKDVALLLVVPAVLAMWMLVGQVYSANLTLSAAEYKDVWTTLASCWLASVYCQEKESTNLSFLRIVLYAEGTASALKMLMLAYCFVRGISVNAMVEALNAFFKVDLMSMDFEGALGRVQFIADGLIPVCIYFLLRYRTRLKMGVTGATFLVTMLALSLVFTFSRYFWAFGVLTFALGLFFGKKDRFHVLLLVVLGAGVLASLPIVISLYQLRFSADVAGGSDNVRTMQIPPLVQFFMDAPFFGHGWGSHTTDVIRSESAPYVYEVQLYALAGQMGLVGLTILALLTGYYYVPLWRRPERTLTRKVIESLILVAWLLAGLFNPMLLSSAAAVSYAAIRSLSFLRDESDAPGGVPEQLQLAS